MNARARPLAILCAAMAAGLMILCHPALAFYAEVKPALKTGSDCIGATSRLAPRLTACTVAVTRMRIWCPNGRMFEGEIERGSPPASLARPLCNMNQVP